MRILISIYLLISLAFLNVPRVWFHDCNDHHERMGVHDETDVHFENDGCYVCDFDLGTYDVLIPSFYSIPKQVVVQIKDLHAKEVACPDIFSNPLRGPPVV